MIERVFYDFFLLVYKDNNVRLWWRNFLSKKNRDVILNRGKKYYEDDKERLREQARDKYRNLSEEKKNEKREYGKNRYNHMFEEKKQKLKEYQKNYRKAKKSQSNNQ